MDLLARIRNIVRWARITKAGGDTDAYPIQQVEYKGKTGDCLMIFPYGMHANLLPDSLVAMFSVEGDPNNRAGVGYTPDNRPLLSGGEVAIYHPATGTIVKLNSSGGIDITASAPVNLSTPTLNITGDVNIIGNVATVGTVTNNGKDIGDTHGHTQGNDSHGSVEQPISGVT